MERRDIRYKIAWHLFAYLTLALIGVGVTASAGSSYAALPPTATKEQESRAGERTAASLPPEEYGKYWELAMPDKLRPFSVPEALQPGSNTLDEVSQPLTGCLTLIPSGNPGTGNNQLFGVDMVSETLGWAVGTYSDTVQQPAVRDYLPDGPGDYNPLILRYDGEDWENVDILDISHIGRLYGVSALSSTSAIAVGTQKPASTWRNLALKWDGISWNELSMPNVGTGQNQLMSVDGNMAAGFYADPSLGARTLIIKSLDGTPEIVKPPNPSNYHNVLTSIATVPGTHDAWATGYFLNSSFNLHPMVLRSQNGGPFDIVTPNFPLTETTGYVLNGVSVAAPNSVYFGGYYVVNGQTDPFILHFDGSQLLQLQTPSMPYHEIIYGVNFASIPGGGVRGVAVGASNDGSGDRPFALIYNTYWWSIAAEIFGQFWGSDEYDDFFLEGSIHQIEIVGEEFSSDTRSRGNDAELGGRKLTLTTRYEDPCGGPQPTPTPGGPTPTPGPPTATPTACTPGEFSDVPPEHTFYPFITCLVNNEIISGYADCTFRPGNNITRGQLSKVVSNAANFTDPASGQTFEDIPVGSTFYDFVERLASRAIIGGYACGGVGEPCVPPTNRPYFRPNANSTRGQISKIVAVAANFQDPTTDQTFEDVPVGSTFHLWIENLASREIMSGYACGGAGEPCVPPGNRPYFRPSNNATRGQTSKIVANTFFPGCAPRR